MQGGRSPLHAVDETCTYASISLRSMWKISVPTVKLAFYIHNYPHTAAIHNKFIFIVDLPLILGRLCGLRDDFYIHGTIYLNSIKQ